MKRTLSILFICSSLFFLAGCSTFVSLAKKEGELLTAEKKKEENKNEADEVKIASEDNETVTDEDLNLKIQPDTDFSSPDNEKGLVLDGRTWKLGHRQERQGNFILEFVQENESVENWTEMITIQGFANPIPARQFARSLEQSLRREVKGELTWNILENKVEGTKSEVIYEFIVRNDPREDDQHEVGVVYSDPERLFVFHYVTKNSPMSEPGKLKWINILRNGLKDGSESSGSSGF